jgi:long-chain fatty acid transport protein
MNNALKLATLQANETSGRSAKVRHHCRASLTLGLGAGLALVSGLARGEGFRNSPPGAFDLGDAGGRIAGVADSSAVTANPANLVDVGHIEANLTPSIYYFSVKSSFANGQTSTTENPIKLLPNFFASMPLLDGKCALGFGLTVPYGIANEWHSDLGSAFKPLGGPAPAAYYTELKTINMSPAFAAKLTDHLQLGLALDVMWSHIRFNQFLAPTLEGEAAGAGFGYGAHAGLTWLVTDKQRLALTLHAPMTVNYYGDFKLNGALTATSAFGTEITYPTSVAVGYGVQVTDKVRLESDVEWLQFSKFNSLPLAIGPNPALPSLTYAEHWKDTFTAGFGADWKVTTNLTLRGGYQYYESPVPDNTFTPSIPDANQNVITMGISYTHKRSTLELGYGLDFYDTRHISNNQNPLLNGTYTFNIHLFSLAFRYAL